MGCCKSAASSATSARYPCKFCKDSGFAKGEIACGMGSCPCPCCEGAGSHTSKCPNSVTDGWICLLDYKIGNGWAKLEKKDGKFNCPLGEHCSSKDDAKHNQVFYHDAAVGFNPFGTVSARSRNYAYGNDKGAHRYNITTFWKPTWCDNCASLLIGAMNQGYSCQGCARNVCQACVGSDAAACFGVCTQHHTLELTTFRRATWCDQCNVFLWGLAAQGMRCKSCPETVCENCAKKMLMSTLNV